MLQRFLHSQAFGSLLLIAATVTALVWANSEWGQSYQEISHTYIGVRFGDAEFKLSFSHWIKDGLMAIFFLVVGLEIKRELLVGELSSFEKALLPVCAAVGGAIVPAAIYAFFNVGGEGSPGWGIPMATDIAFALGVLSLFGSRVPIGLKVFLTALAIADDLLAVVVIALFYTPELQIDMLIYAGIALALMAGASKLGVRATSIYILLAMLVWAFVLASGVHATIAGVLVAMVIPVRPAISPEQLLQVSSDLIYRMRGADNSLDALIHDAERRKALNDLALTIEDATPPGIELEQALHSVQSFIILPLFALFSAGVVLSPETLAEFPTAISLGVIVGLVAGKPVGVLLASWLVIRLAKVDAEGVTLAQLVGAGCLAGIGFTMSIFISELAFTDAALIDEAKVGILVASLTAGVLGAVVLRFALPGSARARSDEAARAQP
jgi:NhaA family Na+:H+ antiporter